MKNKRFWFSLLASLLLAGLAFATDPNGTNTGGAKDVPAAISGEATLAEAVDALGKTRVALNYVWVMIAMFLVMFMQAGFALVETGLVRAKNAGHTMLMNILVYGIGVLGFWAVGFGLQMGGSGGSASLGGATQLNQLLGITIDGNLWGFLGGKGFGLAGTSYDIATFALFFFHMVYLDTALTIPTGAMAERWKTSAFIVYALLTSMLIYPIFANWAWGGGWLAMLGQNIGLGHGYVDFAGSGVIHLTGGVMALTGVIVLGPRIGKYGRDGSVRTIPAHNLPMAVLGTFILAFGWFGFNAGSTLSATDVRFVTVAVSAMLSSAAGIFGALLYSWAIKGKIDIAVTANGLLAGLVANTACGAFIGAPASIVVGLTAGLLYITAADMLEHRFKIDDPVSAIALHGICGIWGVLAVGIFADGTYGNGYNGVAGGVRGLLYGNFDQLGAQLIGIFANFIWIGGSSYIMFRAIDATVGMRVKPVVETEGLDYHDLTQPAYSDASGEIDSNEQRLRERALSPAREPVG
jgi:ammonium transporter, Amt family